MSHRIYQMSFSSIYSALLNKVIRKGGKETDLDDIISWMTGYNTNVLNDLKRSEKTYGEFIQQAPSYNPFRTNITGKICGVQIESIEDPIMQEIRRLDKLVDWLAKGKTVEQIKAKYEI